MAVNLCYVRSESPDPILAAEYTARIEKWIARTQDSWLLELTPFSFRATNPDWSRRYIAWRTGRYRLYL